MVCWVVEACQQAGVSLSVVVVGYKREVVEGTLADYANVTFVEQAEQLGTGHAAMMAEPALQDETVKDVFVLAGDGPLIRPETLTHVIEHHRSTGASATLAILDDPTGYGRVIRDASGGGGFDRIVEQKDATPEQLSIQEVNPSYYCFDRALLFEYLKKVDANNKQNEYYLTDVPGLLKADGHTISVVDAVPAEDVLGINTTEHLAFVDGIMRKRLGS